MGNVFKCVDKATNPLMREEDWESIVGFCDQVNKDLEGPQTAVRLLIHKIQSPQEKESMLALTVSSRRLACLFKRFGCCANDSLYLCFTSIQFFSFESKSDSAIFMQY